MSLSEKELDIEKLKKKYGDMKIGSFNKLLDKSIDDIDIKYVKKALKIKDADIAEMFEFKNVMSYRNSSAKERIEKGIVRIYILANQ